MSALVENFKIGLFSDTVDVIHVKLCMMIAPIALYLFIPLSLTLTIFESHTNVEQLTEN